MHEPMHEPARSELNFATGGSYAVRCKNSFAPARQWQRPPLVSRVIVRFRAGFRRNGNDLATVMPRMGAYRSSRMELVSPRPLSVISPTYELALLAQRMLDVGPTFWEEG